MKTGLSIVELARKIEANQQGKRDFIADTTFARVEWTGKEFTFVMPEQGGYPLLALPHRQIAEHTGVPAKYYDRMKTDAPELLATNVNAWFARKPEKRMVRTMHDNARAFLSNRYQRIENERIAEVALPVLFETPDIKVVSADVTDSRLYIQAVATRVEGEVVAKSGRKVGDVMQAGVVISNSEVGLGRVDVSELDWRLRCLNGMIGESLFKKTHVGRQVEDSESLWADDTRKADDEVLVLKIRDMVRAALDGARFRARLERMNGLASVEIVGDPSKAIEVLAQVVPVSEGEKGGILRSLIQGGDLSAWGLLNAVTHQAHAADYDRAVELGTLGGKLLNLPNSEWIRVLEAA